MKPTVSQQTAKQLAEAGFLPPEVVEIGQWYWAIGSVFVIKEVEPNFIGVSAIGNDGLLGWNPENWKLAIALFAPTALDILAQMPEGTRLVKHGAGWVCAWDLDFVGASVDNREDECPHEASAKAFLAWKAGLG